MKRAILFLIVITTISEGCKKYEDGPCISFRSAKSKFKGKHTLVKYTVDGNDSLNLFYEELGLSFNFIYDDVNLANVIVLNGMKKDGTTADLYIGWELTEHNKIFKVLEGTGGASKGTGVFKKNITPEWEIIKLKLNDKIMKTTYNGKEYLIELKPD